MPRPDLPFDPNEVIREFEARHPDPEAGALFGFSVAGIDSLCYLDDLDENYDRERKAIGGYHHDVIDVAHCRWATGTCITVLDLCAAGLGRVFCGNPGPRELSIADFDPESCRHDPTRVERCEKRRSQLSADALNWIDAVVSDPEYIKIKKARHSLTHARLTRHWNFPLAKGIPDRLELQIADAQQLGTRAIVRVARDVATQHVVTFLNLLPDL
jgi:hypothetical protein